MKPEPHAMFNAGLTHLKCLIWFSNRVTRPQWHWRWQLEMGRGTHKRLMDLEFHLLRWLFRKSVYCLFINENIGTYFELNNIYSLALLCMPHIAGTYRLTRCRRRPWSFTIRWLERSFVLSFSLKKIRRKPKRWYSVLLTMCTFFLTLYLI